jgi:enoyl-CoA hydratase/carnithine racemase
MPQGVFELEIGDAQPCDDSLIDVLAAEAESAASRAILLHLTATATGDGLSARALAWIVTFELPVVVSFEGALAGKLTDLALAADIRLCSSDSSLRGRLTTNARVRTLCDEGNALALFLGREALPAETLLQTGLVSTVTAPGGARAEGQRLASVIASRGPIATRLAKEAIWRGLAQPLPQAMRFETDLTLLLQTTKDRAEGVRAFLEKRPPKFTGE